MDRVLRQQLEAEVVVRVAGPLGDLREAVVGLEHADDVGVDVLDHRVRRLVPAVLDVVGEDAEVHRLAGREPGVLDVARADPGTRAGRRSARSRSARAPRTDPRVGTQDNGAPRFVPSRDRGASPGDPQPRNARLTDCSIGQQSGLLAQGSRTSAANQGARRSASSLDRRRGSTSSSSQVTVSSSPSARPRPAHDPADDHRVRLAGHQVPSGRRGDVHVLGAGTDHPLVVPGQEPHRLRRGARPSSPSTSSRTTYAVGAVDVDRGQPVAEPGEPAS